MEANFLRAIENLRQASTRAEAEMQGRQRAGGCDVPAQSELAIREAFPDQMGKPEIMELMDSIPWPSRGRAWATPEVLAHLAQIQERILQRNITQDDGHFMHVLLQEALSESVLIRNKIDELIAKKLNEHIKSQVCSMRHMV